MTRPHTHTDCGAAVVFDMGGGFCTGCHTGNLDPGLSGDCTPPPGPGEKPSRERSAYARWMDATPPRHEADRQWFAVFDAEAQQISESLIPRNEVSQAEMEAGT
jgi:hypothetical protein